MGGLCEFLLPGGRSNRCNEAAPHNAGSAALFSFFLIMRTPRGVSSVVHDADYLEAHAEHCNLCGACFAACPYMDLRRDDAVQLVQLLLAGEIPCRILRQCTGCMACNAPCPQGLRPYELILLQWYRRYREQGLPARVTYALPHFSPNFRSDLVQSLDARGRQLVRRWSHSLPRGETVLYPGCNALTLPHLLDTKLLWGVTIAGRLNVCCGEMYYRLGLFSAVRRIARWLTHYYRDKDIGTMLFACPACYRMFSDILPHQFGAHFPFHTRFIGSYLRDRLQEEEVSENVPTRGAVMLHDPCHARLLPPDVGGSMRDVLRQVGVLQDGMRDELAGFCCGAASAARRLHLVDMAGTALFTLREAGQRGAGELAVYCAGCQLHFSLWRRFRPWTPPVRHVMQYLKEAVGEDPGPPVSRLTDRLAVRGLMRVLPRHLSGHSVEVEPYLPESPEWETGRCDDR